MTPELQERINKAILAINKKGVNASLIVLGRAEVSLLEDEDPNKINSFRCHYLIDGTSASRCDAYGEQSTSYTTARTYAPKKYPVKQAATYLGLSLEPEPPPPPTVAKADILRAGFVDKSFRGRYGWIEEYHYNRSTPKVKLSLQKEKNGRFKLFHPHHDGEPYYEGKILNYSALQELVQKCAEQQKGARVDLS